MAFAEAFLEILGMIQLLGPVWVAFLLGIMVGWAWKPRWATLGNCKFDFSAPSSPSSALIPPPINSTSSSDSCKVGTASDASSVMDNGLEKEQKAIPSIDKAVCR